MYVDVNIEVGKRYGSELESYMFINEHCLVDTQFLRRNPKLTLHYDS